MKKLKSFLDSVKSLAELLKWYIVAVVAIVSLFAKFWRIIPTVWRAAAIHVPIDARVLIATAILVVLGAAAEDYGTRRLLGIINDSSEGAVAAVLRSSAPKCGIFVERTDSHERCLQSRDHSVRCSDGSL